MYKFPGLVKEDKRPTEDVSLDSVFGDYIKKDLFSGPHPTVELMWNSIQQEKFAPRGNFSASDFGSAEMGKKYHDNMVENLVKFINWYRTYEA